MTLSFGFCSLFLACNQHGVIHLIPLYTAIQHPKQNSQIQGNPIN